MHHLSELIRMPREGKAGGTPEDASLLPMLQRSGVLEESFGLGLNWWWVRIRKGEGGNLFRRYNEKGS